jgi:hypothetical protein
MFHLYQHFPAPRSLQFAAAIKEEFERTSFGSELRPGMRIAVGVGSRGIANLAEIVIAVLDQIRAAGAEPFIVPAMGSHGGATSEGQQEILAEFSVTPETTHAHFETSMEVREIGRFLDDYPVV